MKKNVTAVFDIGKTNKKLIIFDEEFSVVHQEKITLNEIEDDDGYPCEDLDSLTKWIDDRIVWMTNDSKIEFQKLNFSTYGASLVHLDNQGKIVSPFYNYLKPFEEKWFEEFFLSHGNSFQFSLETASPIMGFLNSGFQLFFLHRYKKEIFEKISCSLHFPQFLSYRYTGQFLSEYTSVGCHTAMWDYEKKTYHPWLLNEKVSHLFPGSGIVETSKYIHSMVKGKLLEVGVGIHDSSAALLPYQLATDDLFVLISTGTWNICMNPFNWDLLTPMQLQQDCLNFLSPTGTQVRASRLFFGREFDLQVKELCNYFNCDRSYIENITYDSLIMIHEREPRQFNFQYKVLRPEQFDFVNPRHSDFSRYKNIEEAYHNLLDELTDLQIVSLRLIMGEEPITTIFVDGGFSENSVFVELFAGKLKDYKVYSASVPQGPAIGASLLLNRKIDRQYLRKHTIFKYVKSQVHG